MKTKLHQGFNLYDFESANDLPRQSFSNAVLVLVKMKWREQFVQGTLTTTTIITQPQRQLVLIDRFSLILCII